MKKNKRMIILVSVLLLLGGIALAYFVGRMLSEGTGAEVKVKTAQIESSTVTVKGELQFEEIDILPGHKNVSSISVTATGNNELIPYNLIWNGSNGLNTSLNYTVYKASTKLEVKASCSKVGQPVSGGIAYLEQCEISNIDKLGEPVSEGTIETGENLKEILVEDEFITSTSTGQVVYYYVVLEYPNLDEDQYEYDKGKGFDGEVTVEASDAEPDIEILAAYIENDKGDYEEASDIPQSGYTIDQDRSMCSNDAIPTWDSTKKGVLVTSITKSGTGCVLYFKKSAKDVILGGKNIIAFSGPYTSTDTTDHGNTIYSTEDNDGTSYYYRGAAKNNWVKFGANDAGDKDVWWRIIRINGDGTIRLIYAGTGASAPSQTDPNSIVAKNQYYSGSNLSNDNTYVGFYYGTTNGTYPNNHSNATPSNVATQLKNWYEGDGWKAEDYEQYIDEDAGFCNDRTIHPTHDTWWTSEGDSNRGTGTVATAYGPFSRLMATTESWNSTEQKPTLLCGKNPSGEGVSEDDYKRDLYTLKKEKRANQTEVTKGNGALDVPVGLITADEVIFAGGFGGQSNDGYYLYNGSIFWTMSPRNFSSSYANVFYVKGDGLLNSTSVNSTAPGVRPVINLKADIKLSGTGTSTDPYTIAS